MKSIMIIISIIYSAFITIILFKFNIILFIILFANAIHLPIKSMVIMLSKSKIIIKLIFILILDFNSISIMIISLFF